MEKTTKNTVLIAVLFSVFVFSGCPSSGDPYEDGNTFTEKNVYREESFQENSDVGEETHHIGNQADTAGDLIF